MSLNQYIFFLAFHNEEEERFELYHVKTVLLHFLFFSWAFFWFYNMTGLFKHILCKCVFHEQINTKPS